MTECWAVIDGDMILPSTVHETRRGAMVNWLVAEAGCMVLRHHGDEWIERMWRATKTEARVAKCILTEAGE
jgi:hypothetical protein